MGRTDLKYFKSIERMPRYKMPKKDVQGCDKPGLAAMKRYSPGFPNRVTYLVICKVPSVYAEGGNVGK